jgi:two-component system response regulator RegA
MHSVGSTVEVMEGGVSISVPPIGGSVGAALIVDPSESEARALRMALSKADWKVSTCSTARAAKEFVVKSRPDLMVTELRLNDGPTLGLIEWCKRRCPAMSIVVLTGHDSVATVVKCAKLGVSGYLRKPASSKEVLAALRLDERAAEAVPRVPMSLQRAQWEHLNQAFVLAGSISRAASLLGLDRRSLRRMLSKNAPPPAPKRPQKSVR